MIPLVSLLLVGLAGCDRVLERLPGSPDATTAPTASASADPAAPRGYTCPMHPSVQQAGPGQCPLCGMNLVPVTDAGDGAVAVSAEERALAGVETVAAAMREMRVTVRAPGVVRFDERGLTDVTTKVMGYVREAPVAAVGDRVRRGQTLLTLYSPELLVAQEELLAAVAATRDGDPAAPVRAEAARRRLRLWDVPDSRIDAIVASGRALDAVPLPSPADGAVVEEGVTEGAAVMAGARLYRIGDPRKVWIDAQVPEADLARLRSGMTASVAGPALAEGRPGKLATVLPTVDPTTRAATARVTVDNADGALLPDAWVTVTFTVEAGPRLAVPDTAVLWTGPRRVVFVDTGDGRLAPREVQTGVRADGYTEIVSGLHDGERVVTEGAFEVASESRIQGGG